MTTSFVVRVSAMCASFGYFPASGTVLDLRAHVKLLLVLAGAAFSFPHRAVVLHHLDRTEVLDHLEAELGLEADAQGRSVLDGQLLAIQLVGEDRLPMMANVQGHAF